MQEDRTCAGGARSKQALRRNASAFTASFTRFVGVTIGSILMTSARSAEATDGRSARAELLKVCGTLLRRSRYEEASQRCEQLMHAAPDWWKAHAMRARILLEWGKDFGKHDYLELAVEAFDWTLEMIRHRTRDGGDSDVCEMATELIELHNDRGVALLEMSNLEQAKKAFFHALELHPSHDRALCNLGLVQWQEGHERVALSTFDKAIAANASNAHTLNNRGALRLERGEYEAALPDFHAAIALEPWYDVARRNRNEALSELSEPVPLSPVLDEQHEPQHRYPSS